MTRYNDREEALHIAAEKIRRKKEKEEREDREFYERITSGTPWLIFKAVVAFCTAMIIVSTIEVCVDGPSKKLTENDWKIDRNWEYTWHKVLDVKGYMFTPELKNWSNRVKNTLSITYTPIFRTGKTLRYDVAVNDLITVRQEEVREQSIFTWFPEFQIVLLIPLITFLFKRQSPWFNFGRITSLVLVFPGTLLVIFLSLLH